MHVEYAVVENADQERKIKLYICITDTKFSTPYICNSKFAHISPSKSPGNITHWSGFGSCLTDARQTEMKKMSM